MAQTGLRGSTSAPASPAKPQARSVRTAAETAVRPTLPQIYLEAQNLRSGEYGIPANSYDHSGSWIPGSAPTEQNAWELYQEGLRDPKLVEDPDKNYWGRVHQGLEQYFSDIEKYNTLIGSGPATNPRAATAPVEERSASFQARRRGLPETILTAGWGLDEKPRTLAKTILGE